MRIALGAEPAENVAEAAQQLACDVYNRQPSPDEDGPDALVSLFTALACYSVVAIEHLAEACGMPQAQLRMLLSTDFDDQGAFCNER
ncbi:hypothetical protein AB8O64_36725 (plasmid) [Streptomyces sp. QH1-20]|uniref:hypothetical protein n=1 Tax=Streptomyces sp. QH1-20 TaxID=3240934 RepID=UPI0035125847